ncbi:hypothetical protein FK498_06825 [Elioraea sp. Yellowstone]|jgi:hypothetical protein|uniref:hypothetical protein n=1 Tax=Elioraea sp. Yellowstone TaxID=2592070 RepID=UPI00114F92C1|nr:hypothetical protein [Elioraea sp. Yellowstone]TQF79976.1 hypothetical protein FK498_06825 [Elioraea sp. Yellowstone]
MVGRRWVIALGAVLAGCAGPAEAPRPVIRPFDYSHLTPIKLDVATVEVVDQWVPPRAPPHVDHRAPIEPREALRRMLADRVQAWGNRGRARALITEASLVEQRLPREGGLGAMFTTQQSERYVLTLSVRLEVEGGEGRGGGSAQATVTRSRTVAEGTSLAAREAVWYEMLRSAMDDPQGMNVEFEFQVRRALRPFIVPEGTPRPPPGGTIETQELAPPPGATAPAPAGGTLGTVPVR